MSSSRRTSSSPPFSSFGWSFAAAILIALSLPPLGLFPLAWVALVPFMMRWMVRKPSLDYTRELYALLLTTSCCVGFWLLFNPDPQAGALGGASLFLTPIPLTAAFAASNFVKDRLGLWPGLVALGLNIVAAEFITLQLSFSMPWLVLGHTQVEGLEFIQMADIGGVLLLSLWVFLLNVTVFLALPKATPSMVGLGERGAFIAVFAGLIIAPVVYGSVRTAQSDVPTGYTRVGVVQPGVPPDEWDEFDADRKVQHLAELSDSIVGRWRAEASDSTATTRQSGAEIGVLVWPQTSIPRMEDQDQRNRFYTRLTLWAERRNVSVLAGATLGAGDGEVSSAAVLIRPGEVPVQYEQMRRIRVAEPNGDTGSRRVLFETAGTSVAATVGFESVFGDHLRRFTGAGSNLMVVLSRNDIWGRSAGLYQHLMFTRLRAIESRRAVLLSTLSGVSAMILPSGTIEQTADWMDEAAISTDVPTFRGETFYVRHGDWLGVWGLLLALVFNLGAALFSIYMPVRVRKRAKRPARSPATSPFR
ncbi:MAG: nitrilase-related carbon-nitrogen hydrolase [Bacteroidota bacterium]